MNSVNILSEFNLILIRYSDEIWLKSDKVKIRMIKLLMNNIKRILEANKLPYHKYQMTKDSARILYFLDNKNLERAIEIFKKIFGIYSFSPALRTSDKIEHITKRVLEIADQILEKNDTFALRVTRSGTHEFTSQDIAIKVGQAINDKFKYLNISVDLTSPDKVIFIEVRNQFTYIFLDVIKSDWHGLPTEPYKKVVIHDIGRLEDILAGFLLMRRGCEIYPILFSNSGSEQSFKNRLKNWRYLLNYTPRKKLKIIKINLSKVLDELLASKIDHKYLCAICRLLRFESIAEILKNSEEKNLKKVKAISDGTALNQASLCYDEVDLASLALNYLFSNYPTFTPLIGLDLNEIKQDLNKISLNFENINYCKFKPKSQTFDLEKVKKLYNSLNKESLLKGIISNLENIILKKN